ncbi:MAG: M48 family metallopeptidase [Cellulosilyticum sp.]|nr:M48 family metallopeptidase [Cellulosilyticum sp.]
MKLSFDYKGIKVTYYLTYKKAKAISIKITDEGRVNVIAPLGTSVFTVMDKVKGNAPWIISEIYSKQNVGQGMEMNTQESSKKELRLLEQYMYSGKNYKLEVVPNSEAEEIKVKMVRGKFVVETATDSVSEIRGAIVEWYKQKVKAKIKDRFKEYGSMFEVIPNAIQLTDDQQVLFKANTEEIIANAKLGILPGDVIDYVLVSSLCRINATDATSEVEKLEEILPNYQKSKEWLEANKSQLVL